MLIPRYNEINACKETSKTFVKAVIDHDIIKAKSLSQGKILWQLQNASQLPKAKTGIVDAQIVYLKGQIAKIFIVCEMETEFGQDVAWYNLYLLKNKDKWRIYKATETTPDPWGIKVYCKSNSIPDAEESITRFILAATSGEDAKQYLAGPARRTYEQVPAGLAKEKPTDIRLIPLYSDKKSSLYKASYSLENREVNVLLSLYKLETWRIVAVNQI